MMMMHQKPAMLTQTQIQMTHSKLIQIHHLVGHHQDHQGKRDHQEKDLQAVQAAAQRSKTQRQLWKSYVS